MRNRNVNTALISHEIEHLSNENKGIGLVRSINTIALDYFNISSNQILNKKIKDLTQCGLSENHKFMAVYEDIKIDSINTQFYEKEIDGQFIVISKMFVDDRVIIQITLDKAHSTISQSWSISNLVTNALSEVHWSVSLPENDFTHESPSYQEFFDLSEYKVPSDVNWLKDFIHPEDS